MTVSAATRRAHELVLRRIFAIVLIVLGVGTVGVGVGLATVWRPSETVTATLPSAPEVPVVVAGGNVLATVNDDVTVTVKGADAQTPIVLAMGHESDVKAWLGDSTYEQITGLQDWSTLAVTSSNQSDDATASPSADDDSDKSSADNSDEKAGSSDEKANKGPTKAADPAGSDLWIEQVSGEGELSYDWSRVDGRWMMLVASNGSDPAPTVSLSWQRQVTTPFVIPAYIVGGVLFVIGAVWLAFELLIAHERRKARAAVASSGQTAISVATTDADGKPLTRRQIREAERAAERKRRGNESAPSTSKESEESRGEEAAQSVTLGSDEETSVLPAIVGEDGQASEEEQASSAADPASRAERRADLDQRSDADQHSDGASDLAAWVRNTTGGHNDSGQSGPDQAGSGTRVHMGESRGPAFEEHESSSAADPQASAARALGASWRQTWGITTSAASPAQEGETGTSSSAVSPVDGDDEENEGKANQ